MPNPLIKRAKRNTHSDPPPPSLGGSKGGRNLSFEPPTWLERRNKQVSFFSTISGFFAFYQEKCRTSLHCLLNLFLCHAPPMKKFGIQNMYPCMRCFPPPKVSVSYLTHTQTPWSNEAMRCVSHAKPLSLA